MGTPGQPRDTLVHICVDGNETGLSTQSGQEGTRWGPITGPERIITPVSPQPGTARKGSPVPMLRTQVRPAFWFLRTEALKGPHQIYRVGQIPGVALPRGTALGATRPCTRAALWLLA